MIRKYDIYCDTAYGRFKNAGAGLADGERIKRQYCEDGWNKTRWDILSEQKKDNGKTQFLIAAPGFVTMVTLTERQQKKCIKKIITTHREYTVEEYKYLRCDEGWNGFLRGKEYVCGIPYIDQLGI